MMFREVQKQIDRALSSVRQAYRAVITLCSSDGPVQLAQIDGLADEVTPDVEVFQHYGYTSNPPAGAMAVVVPLGGKTSHGVVVATEHASYRIVGLKPGEVAIYTDEGDSMIFRRGRVIDIVTETLNIKAGTAVNIDTPKVSLTHELAVAEQISGSGGMEVSGGDGVKVSGKMDVTEDVVVNGKSLFHHRHPETGTDTDEMI